MGEIIGSLTHLTPPLLSHFSTFSPCFSFVLSFSLKTPLLSFQHKKHLQLDLGMLFCLLCVCVVCSCAKLCLTPWTIACRTLLPMRFSQPGYWSGLHFLLQGIFLTQGSNLHLLPGCSALAGGFCCCSFLILKPPGKPVLST